ncbi:OmpW/AlkL family protein [Acetobacter ghanensis]|uniref:OmpW family protein n=1 Tax=Acetobacter ghanensis TaxID=431306 RepID=A0A0U5F0G4_9PROT|nr:OmpW family outer membrane protein [Acetobacter ghanensis]NHO39886.1 outer membrane beta-barrel protein [Acetobacter ghanensis]GBQ47267.1 outer membrane protein OmpW [Acetobacter ghanensis DSM 18895]CEF53728.1 OmpW family protein [Acetobacter ghanensis]
MVKFRSFLTATVAGVAALTGAAQAQTATPNAAYVNAPVMNHIPDAQKPSGHCGIFETCASTKIGLGKGDIMVRLSGVGVLPQDRDSRVNVAGGAFGSGTRLNGTHLSTTNQAMPELTVEYFITDNLSVDLIATSTHHRVNAVGGALAGVTHSEVTDVGSAWVLPPTLTFAWHFRPHKRFNPYVGVGVTAMWFHNMSGRTQPLGLTKLNSGFTGGPAVNVGFDYQLVGNWFFNADVKQMFVRMHAWAENQGESLKVSAHESLDPTVVSAGIAYRF